jgi:hypothetical protein
VCRKGALHTSDALVAALSSGTEKSSLRLCKDGLPCGATPFPRFDSQLVEGNVLDGYEVEAFDVNGDGLVDVFVSGLAYGDLVW